MPFFFRRYRIAAATIPSTAPESENRNVRLRTSAVIARAKGSLLKLLSAGAAAVETTAYPTFASVSLSVCFALIPLRPATNASNILLTVDPLL